MSTQKKAPTKSSKPKDKKEVVKKEVKKIPVYDNKQRELKTLIQDGQNKIQVSYDNNVVYLGTNLNEAIEKYNSSGITKWIMPKPPERKKPEKKTKSKPKKDTTDDTGSELV